MAFTPLQLRFIRFLGPEKEPAEYPFTPGLNILWGSSATGKTFLVKFIDSMLVPGFQLNNIPDRVGNNRNSLILKHAFQMSAANNRLYERAARKEVASALVGCSLDGPRSRIMHLIDPPPLARNSLTSTNTSSTPRSRI